MTIDDGSSDGGRAPTGRCPARVGSLGQRADRGGRRGGGGVGGHRSRPERESDGVSTCASLSLTPRPTADGPRGWVLLEAPAAAAGRCGQRAAEDEEEDQGALVQGKGGGAHRPSRPACFVIKTRRRRKKKTPQCMGVWVDQTRDTTTHTKEREKAEIEERVCTVDRDKLVWV